jgi:tripartite-type tricarboxylate transporter receptor subunit TctC
MKLRRQALIRIVTAAVTFVALLPTAATPQAALPRNVTLVVPYSTGTGIDILARTLGPHLATRWRNAVVVDNKPGASSSIGTEFVARAPGDGSTLLVTATSFVTNAALNKSVPYDPVKGFAPIAVLGTGTLALLVSADTPAKSLRDFVALAKSKPGALNYASSGNGTPQHLAMELMKLELGLDIVHVPYKGSGGAMGDLAGGHVTAMIAPVHTAVPYVHSGKVRMLAVMNDERVPTAPSVPTFKEEGFPLQVDVWYAMFAPASTPPALVAKLNADVNAVLQMPEVRENLAKQGLQPVGGPPEKLAALVRDEQVRWPRVVSAANIKAD